MANLYLVRHGQASFMQDNYDKLSNLGQEQAALLGEYWIKKRYNFDVVLVGFLERQVHTYQIIKNLFSKDYLHFPEATQHEGLNEHQGAELHHHFLPEFLNEEENKPIQENLQKLGVNHPTVRKELLRLFFRSTKQWASGILKAEGYESFEDFKNRVKEGYDFLKDILQHNENVVAFTSGGTIGMLLGWVLGLDDEKVIELNWQVRNCSVTELTFSKGKFFLRGFNHIAHLEETHHITYV